MKKHNIIWNISIIGIIIGGLITLISYMKFEKANRHYNLSITNGNFDTAYAWSDDVEKFKIILIIGAIILVISLICFIGSVMTTQQKTVENISNNKNDLKSPNTTNKIKELKNMYDNGLITEEEFQDKKKDLLDKM